MKNLLFKNTPAPGENKDEFLKTTALMYLEEALFRERFEDCDELIRTAKGFGAQLDEIKAVILGHLNKSKGNFRNEANRNEYGYPRVKGGK